MARSSRKPSCTGLETITMDAISDQRWRHRLSELRDQFVLDQKPSPPFDTWVSEPIGAYTLHTHPNTQVRRFSGSRGDAWVIGGIIAAEDATIAPENCPPGQYVVITASEVFSDAGSLMQAFFDPSAKIVASSLRLLTNAGDKSIPPELLHGSRPDWYWGPRTTFPWINYLLPSQRLDLKTFTPKFRQLPRPSNLSQGDAAKALRQSLSDSFVQLAANGRPIRLAMTGGIDSRTLFAAALDAGIEFETYTMASRHVHPKDVEVAARISGRFGVPHSILRMGRLDAGELDWYLWFSAGEAVTLDADFHAAGLWNHFAPETIYVRGLGFTLGRHKYRDFLSREDQRLVRDNPSEIWKRFTKPWVRPLHLYNRQAFESYADWLAETLDCSEMDFRDRLFLEQGMGAWDASAEHGLAATGTRRIAIANSTQPFELLLQERNGPKTAGPLQREIMGAIEPALLDYPFIKPTRAERLRYRALDTLRALRLRQRLKRLR